MLSMEDRKVYIGRIVGLGEPNEKEGMDQEIMITPYASGYRDKDNLSIDLTTTYNDISNDIVLILKQENIISATHFSDETFEKFKKNSKFKKKKILLRNHPPLYQISTDSNS